MAKDDEINSRAEWRRKFSRYLVPQLSGDQRQNSEVIRTLALTWHKTYREGQEDVLELVRCLAAQRNGDDKELLTVVADSIEALIEKNQADFSRTYQLPDNVTW